MRINHKIILSFPKNPQDTGEKSMAYRALSETEFAEVRDWFFNKGIESDVAGEKLALLSIAAEKDNLPEIEVHRRLAKG